MTNEFKKMLNAFLELADYYNNAKLRQAVIKLKKENIKKGK